MAVLLRRVSARLEDGDDMSRVMLASALVVVEATFSRVDRLAFGTMNVRVAEELDRQKGQ